MNTVNDIYSEDNIYSLNFNRLLLEMTNKVNNNLSGDGCSIFFKDMLSDCYILQETTVSSENIGIEYIDPSDSTKKGLTCKAIKEKCPIRTDDITKEPDWDTSNFCELPENVIGPFLAVPIFSSDNEVVGVIRIVRKKEIGQPFSEKDEKELINYIKQKKDAIDNAFTFSDIIDIGTSLDISEFCERTIQTINKATRAKGCTIFVLDIDKSTSNKKIYRSFSTTGLYDWKTKKLIDSYSYEVNLDNKFSFSCSEWSIKNKKRLFLNDIYSSEELESIPNLTRKPGVGQVCEYVKSLKDEHGGAILYSPIFSRDKKEVVALARVVRPRVPQHVDSPNTNFFNETDKRNFIAFLGPLSRVMSNIFLVNLINKYLSITTKHDLINLTVNELPNIFGGEGCSIFFYDNITSHLNMAATKGFLEDKFKRGKIKPYKLGEGWTGWVGKYRKTFMFNSESEIEGKCEGLEVDIPEHSKRINECEVGGESASKWLGAPILYSIPNNILFERELIGVIRIPKRRHDSNFTDFDIRLIDSIAKHLGQRLYNIEKYFEKIERNTILTIAAEMAHRIGNPLFSIELYLSKLKEENPGDSDVAKVYKSIMRAKDILDKIERVASDKKYSFQEYDINELIQSSIPEALINNAKIKLKTDFAKNLPLLKLDLDEMKLCFNEFIKNSVEAFQDTKVDNRIIKIKTRKIDNPHGRPYVQIDFTDNGPGIEKKDKNAIFRAFMSSKKTSSGLGLSINEKIVEGHRGSIQEVGIFGKGAHFAINLFI